MSDDETQPASTTDELWIEDDEPPSPDDLPGEERTAAEEPAPLGAGVPVAPGALGGFVTPIVVPAAAAAAPPDEDSPDPDVAEDAER
jgi:hypothetical protein